MALLCGLWQSANVSRYTAGTGMYGFRQYVPAVAEVPQTALLCGLWQSENVSSNTAGMGMYGFGQYVPAVAEVP